MKKLLSSLAVAALFAACNCGGNKNNAMNDMAAKNIASVTRFNDEVFNKHNLSLVDSMIAPDYVEHNPDPNYASTRDGMKKSFTDFFAAFPDLSIKVSNIVADSDEVCFYSTMSGTNTGSMMGMPATGKKINVNGIDILRIKDGKVIEHWGLYDQVKMMQQMGMMPDMSGMPKDSGKMMDKK